MNNVFQLSGAKAMIKSLSREHLGEMKQLAQARAGRIRAKA